MRFRILRVAAVADVPPLREAASTSVAADDDGGGMVPPEDVALEVGPVEGCDPPPYAAAAVGGAELFPLCPPSDWFL
jgi:hypothetical protein